MSFTYDQIPLKSIDFSNDWNLHPWELHQIPETLKESFSQTGVIQPPIVMQTTRNRFSIVHGFKRLLFLKECDHNLTPVCLNIAQNSSHVFILDLLLTDQPNATQLTLAEKAQFLKVANQYLDTDTIIEKFLPRLKLKQRKSTYHNALEILEQDKEIIHAIHAGELREKMVAELLKLRYPSDRLALVLLFKQLALGDGKQRKIFILLRDLAFRQESTIEEYLNEKEIQQILNHKNMNIPQKTQHLGVLLGNRHTPSSTQAEEEFNELIKSLHLPAHCSISHSKSFERDQVTLSITFKNMSECKEKWAILKRTLDTKSHQE